MAWLNINRDLEYDYDPLLLDMCEIEPHQAGRDFPLVVVDCDMPFKSGMENNRHWWGYRGTERTKHGLNTWLFKDYVIEKNVGKSFSQAFSYFCKFVDRQYQKYFLEAFQNYEAPRRKHYFEKYWIDENDVIQKVDEKKEKSEIVFISSDYEEKWLIQTVSNPWAKYKILNQHVRTLPKGERWAVQREFRSDIEFVKLLSTKGIKRTFSNTKSRVYQRLRYEDIKLYNKRQREEERKKKETVYSFLTREEKELKKQKELDQYNLYRHGFDDESFKGNPYHGRKNKKQRREEARINARIHGEM